MTLEDVKNYFGNYNKACKALNIKPQNMTTWKKYNYIPYKQQFRLAHLTEGELMPDDEDPAIAMTKAKKKK